jgi:predicted MFS family arabinose efflux permease
VAGRSDESAGSRSATPFGFLFGAVIAGILGGRIGRRSVMLYALIFCWVFTLVAVAAPNYAVFVGARVLAGLGTGAESAIIAPFLAEFVPLPGVAGSLVPWPASSPSGSSARP